MSNIYDKPKPTEPAEFFVYPPKETHIILPPQNEIDDMKAARERWENEAFKKAIIKLGGE